MNRRKFCAVGLATAISQSLPHSSLRAQESANVSTRQAIGVSSYSFWRFRNDDFRPLTTCLDHAAEIGFDGLEILQRQLTDTSPAALNEIKRHAFSLGLDLMGYSTHQGFVSPDADKRKKNISHTIDCLEQAYQMGIPTMRVNTGTWGTSKSFDDLMANKGIEPPLEGHTDEEGFGWTIDAYTQLAAEAKKRGVVMGLENHWGLGRTAAGVIRVIEAVDSPWLRATLDTGNFLENKYEQMTELAPHCALVQAKTYYGGGTWYTLDLDYARIAEILATAGYHGYISLEFEGKADILPGIRKSLAELRKHF
jgi:sugar phosphate isomerase/epimerase